MSCSTLNNIRFLILFTLLFLALTGLPLFASEPPELKFDNQVNPVPRPYKDRVDVTTWTSIYFEVLVPDTNGTIGKVDTDTITATLNPAGGDPVPMLLAGQVFASGFSGKIIPEIDSGDYNGDAVYIILDNPLDPNRLHTVSVYAETLDGVPINTAADSWSFTTRPMILDPTVSWDVDLTGPTVHWEGWFFTGILKPDFNTSRLFDQLDSYDLMDTVNAINPDAWSLQRDWPLTGDYWHNGVFDGNPNPVREMETRQIIAIENKGKKTLLTVKDLEEGPLYGIPPDRPLGDDFHTGDLVTIADREKYEVAEVQGVDEHAGVVKVSQLLNLPASWILDYSGSHPNDLPETPDNFTLPLCYLRKHNPIGTPVYYWNRIDDEWDIVHAQHGRRLQVNFSWTPLDLSSEPVPANPGGHGSISPPKSYHQWHDFVREMIFHLIDRYGEPTLDFYYSVGNEHNFPIFWSGGKDGFYELYDYTVNAILTAFEDRGMDASQVHVGGLEAAWYGGRGWTRDALYHCSGAADKPEGGIVEYNYVCADPRMDGKRAARVEAICAAYGGKGSPIDFVSMHEYRHASDSVSDMNYIRDTAIAMDSTYYENLNVTCFECTPDWIPRPDPAAGKMYEGNGYFPTWCGDWMQRMVARAETDTRYARHETVLTVWPFDYNGQGISSITGLIRMDDDGDGTEDRIATIKKGIFNYIELLAHMNRDLDTLPAQDIEGIRFAGVRSPAPDVHKILLYNHDKYDTESSEETEFIAQLSLTGIPWTAAKINRWRVDRDHSSPYHAYQALPEKSLYAAEDIVALEESDDLVEDGPPQYFETPSGSLNLSVPIRVNGVTFVEIRKWDEDQDGIVGPDDCDDANDQVWSAPGESQNLLLTHDKETGETTLMWDPPADLGATFGLYDTIRSDSPSNFETDAVCVETDGSDTTSIDTDSPDVGSSFYYLTRAENTCPLGQGSLGTDSNGMERNGLNCP